MQLETETLKLVQLAESGSHDDAIKYYPFIQNNSGGYFVNENNIGYLVIIEARTEQEALFRAEEAGMDFSENNPISGRRWSNWFLDAEIYPSLELALLNEEKSIVYGKNQWDVPSYVHMMDGSIYLIEVKNEKE